MPASRSWLNRSVPAVVTAALAAALVVAAAWPSLQARRARREAAARVGALARGTGGACDVLDPGLSMRVQRLGPWLSSWETVGGCGAGAAAGTGVKWIGHNTTGGLFQVIQQSNYVNLVDYRSTANNQHPGYNIINTTQISKDLSDKWNLGVSLPLIYKYYYDWNQTGYDVSNGGLGDVSALITRRLGKINATSLTAIVGFPTGTYADRFRTVQLSPDQQLGFGRPTGWLMVDHTLDQQWGLVVLGGTAGYRGGRNSVGNYRGPSASVWSYAGYFLGPLVPAIGLTFTGYSQQDTTSTGETLNAPVATGALNGSLEWSNDYLAILLGATFPYALRGDNWGKSGSDYGIQPWTVALGLSLSPF